ncbi:MAG: hypothetical protein ACI4JX_01205 [Oscillospiraceae bacterium]
MKIIKRTAPVLMSCALLMAAVTPTFAAEVSSEKEEVIYVNLAADGSVKDVYAVNIFEGGDITDYGDYSSVEMLNTTDKISQSGDLITFSSSADRVYCKGKMNSTVIPWNISIKYLIDGKEYSADEAAGKSGELEIKFKVEKNEAYTGDFFDDYALQAAFTLDTEKCRNITASGATIANVGSKKQISYTMLPGEGIDAVITADVTEFEMAAASINGVPLSMDIEVDDGELMDRVAELINAIAELDGGADDLKSGVSRLRDAAEKDLQTGVGDLADGADKLYGGAGSLKDGAEALKSGTGQLKNGAAELDNGARSLNGGVSLIQEGLTELNGKSDALTGGSSQVNEALLAIQKEISSVTASAEQVDALVSGSSQIKEGIASLSEGVAALQNNVSFAAYKAAMKQNGLDIDELEAANSKTVETLNGQLAVLNEQIIYLEQAGGDETQIAQLKASAQQLQSIVTLIQGNSAALNGADVYLTQINSSIGELAAVVGSLREGCGVLDNGINELAVELKNLMGNMAALRDGIDTLVEEYGNLDSGINEYTEGVAQVVAGYSQVAEGTVTLLNGSKQLKGGTAELYGRTDDFVNGISQFYDAADTLKSGAEQLESGTAELVDGIDEAYGGASELKDGTAQMREKTDGMDDEISDKIDEMIESFTGQNTEVSSFVSEKNTNVKAVQFIIQTESVKMDEAAIDAVVQEEKLTFWQKILRLFGLY